MVRPVCARARSYGLTVLVFSLLVGPFAGAAQAQSDPVPFALHVEGQQDPDAPVETTVARALGAHIGALVTEAASTANEPEAEPEEAPVEEQQQPTVTQPPVKKVQKPSKPKPVRRARHYRSQIAWPVRSTITSDFGWRSSGFHHGLDLRCPVGYPIRNAKRGKVVFAGMTWPYGKTVIVRHPGGYRTLYAHMSRMNVRSGARVDGNRILGRCGATGNARGPHLHFEIYRHGKIVNPHRHLPR